jgi:hypothetical protein
MLLSLSKAKNILSNAQNTNSPTGSSRGVLNENRVFLNITSTSTIKTDR